ncbi:hypothetical protein DY218_26815 [Streptomyces triticagri]|uniref:DUF308 domain-containing protein n=1 Tax=Streptomyces triticagri TaxID=2293568 RepID=A0A372LYA7_9ACTN|nr:hypothetical protein [Streptomyces triticagri]RFU83529.1 hypothetical protein DY218_26815 [Streptomyces triticagri]
MTEHDADRDRSREEKDGPEDAAAQGEALVPETAGGPPQSADAQPEEAPRRLDEDEVWAEIVAGYGDEPPDPPGAKPFKSVEDLAGLVAEATGKDAPAGPEPDTEDSGRDRERGEGRSGGPVGGSIAFAPGVGPRDYSPREPAKDDPEAEADDEGHFVPPEPPPLPSADTTARFAWLAVIGGPLLLLVAILLSWPMTWWLATLSIGGFLGGFATLVMRMSDDDEEDEDPGRGAVV